MVLLVVADCDVFSFSKNGRLCTLIGQVWIAEGTQILYGFDLLVVFLVLILCFVALVLLHHLKVLLQEAGRFT